MPRVASYDPQVGIAQTTGARYQAATNDSGEIIARGLQSLGVALGNAAETAIQVRSIRADQEAREAGIAYANKVNTLRHDPASGYLLQQEQSAVDGYKAARTALDAIYRESATGLSPGARRRFEEATAARRIAYQDELDTHYAAETLKLSDRTFRRATDTNRADAIASYQDENVQAAAVDRIVKDYAAHALRHGIPAETGLADARDEVSKLRLGVALRWAEQDAAKAKDYSTRFAGQMNGEDQATAERAIRIAEDREGAEQRRIAAEARATQTHDVALRREQLATAEAALADGAGTSADWNQLADEYTKIGDTSSAQKARNRAGEMRASDGYRSATLPEIDARISELEAKPSLTPAEAAEAKGLKARRETTAARLAQPGGAIAQHQYATGRTLAPLQANDPATYRSRAAQAVTAARTYGRRVVEPLTAAEAQPLKDLASSGDSAKRLSALTAIAKFGDPRAIDGAARQITDKGDGAFRIAATLSTLPGDAGYQAARDILRGPEAAKTNGQVFLPKAALTSFQSYAGPALRGLSPDYAADVLDAARNLYVARMTTAGRTQWNDDAWHTAIDVALGSYRSDGIVYGGTTSYRGARVSLPPGWTGDGVFRRIARASGKELTAASVGGAPQWPDGSPVYSGQIRDLVPVRLGGTRYGFLTRNNRMLGTKSGGVFQLDVAKVPWR